MTTTLGHVSDNQSFHDKDRVQPPHLSINQREQLLAEIHDVLSPYDFIKLCVTNNLLDLMVRETNRHAAQFISDNSGSLKTHSVVHKWKDTEREETSQFCWAYCCCISHVCLRTGRLMKCFTHLCFGLSCHEIGFPF